MLRQSLQESEMNYKIDKKDSFKGMSKWYVLCLDTGQIMLITRFRTIAEDYLETLQGKK